MKRANPRCNPSGSACTEGQYTGCCIDCGYNVYMTRDEYHDYLREQVRDEEIKALEKRLAKE
jgi:hypothetical protein